MDAAVIPSTVPDTAEVASVLAADVLKPSFAAPVLKSLLVVATVDESAVTGVVETPCVFAELKLFVVLALVKEAVAFRKPVVDALIVAAGLALVVANSVAAAAVVDIVIVLTPAIVLERVVVTSSVCTLVVAVEESLAMVSVAMVAFVVLTAVLAATVDAAVVVAVVSIAAVDGTVVPTDVAVVGI